MTHHNTDGDSEQSYSPSVTIMHTDRTRIVFRDSLEERQRNTLFPSELVGVLAKVAREGATMTGVGYGHGIVTILLPCTFCARLLTIPDGGPGKTLLIYEAQICSRFLLRPPFLSSPLVPAFLAAMSFLTSCPLKGVKVIAN